MSQSCCSKGTPTCPLGVGGPFKSFCPFSLALFAGTGYTYLRYLRHKSNMSSSSSSSDGDAQPRPIVFAGPSGVGKGTLIELLRKKYPTQFGFSVSHTTRNPREGEENGVHYNFTSVDAIQKEIEAGKFVEYANVHGNYYGTSVAAVEIVKKQGKICILDIDVQGVRNVKKSTLDAICIFIAPPSMGELEKRLRGRGTETEEAVVKRLKNAKEELDYGLTEGNFDRVFTNDDLDKTFKTLDEQFQQWYPQLTE
ncbi:hypothetical protein ACHAWF_007492 [Thalassiosira exigua]